MDHSWNPISFTPALRSILSVLFFAWDTEFLSGDSVSQIVAKGTTGIWTYTKYADGSAECYGTTKHSFTKTGTFWLPDVKLPFPFVKPANTYKNFTIVVAGGEYFAHAMYPHYPLEEASVSTVRCAVADVTESGSIAVNYIVRGRWKQ